MPRRQKRSSRSYAVRWLGAAVLAFAIAPARAALAPGKLTVVFRAVWAQAQDKPAPPSKRAGPAEKTDTGQSSQAQQAGGKEEEEKDKVVVEHADKLRYDGDKKVYRLEGNVRIRHKDSVLTCDWAEYYEDTDTAVARGHLLLMDPETSVTGDVIKIDFTDEVAEIEGNVVIVSEKKKEQKEEGGAPAQPAVGGAEKNQAVSGKTPNNQPAPASGKSLAAGNQAASQNQDGNNQTAEEKKPTTIKEYRERKTTVYCTKVKYRYTEGQRYAWISGPIRAEQKDRTAWAERAEYDVDDGVLKLTGNVRVKTAEGDEFQCPAATVSVDEEWLRAEKVTGIAIRKKKGQEKSPPSPSGAPGPAESQPPQPPQ
ncbi:MAG: hypothetical protein H5T86_06365 [Armatimonadetes bacterium]|nr:hypothetical protein [Armatimonadota bacterium]